MIYIRKRMNLPTKENVNWSNYLKITLYSAFAKLCFDTSNLPKVHKILRVFVHT
jgi:hypothetical protein